MSKKIFIAHGDITADYIYDSDYNLIKKDGGGCNSNVISHLSLMGEKCYVVGTVGEDAEGEIAIESLKRTGVITDLITKEEKQTNTYHIIMPNKTKKEDKIVQSRVSPLTGKNTVSLSDALPIILPTELLEKEKIIVLERMQPINLKFISNLQNKQVCLDIGSRNTFINYEKEYLLQFLRHIQVLQLQGELETILLDKLQLCSTQELFKKTGLDLLIETRNERKCQFYFSK